MKDIDQIAGLDVRWLIKEQTAASLAFGIDQVICHCGL